jgi:GlpG protein
MLFPLGFGVDQGQYGLLFSKMTFLAMDRLADGLYFTSLSDTFESGEIWRLVTPMFIHFGALHIVFNLLWVWEIGRRIEFVNGALMFVGLVLLSSVTANMTQYLMSGPSLFGGMSGVVFGLLGHSLLWSLINPDRSTGVPKGIYIFMLVYLGIGFTGAIDLLGMGNLANGAHLGGLIAGVVTGATAGLLARRHPRMPLQ